MQMQIRLRELFGAWNGVVPTWKVTANANTKSSKEFPALNSKKPGTALGRSNLSF